MADHGLWRCVECSVVLAPDSSAPNHDGVECPACDESSWSRLGRVR